MVHRLSQSSVFMVSERLHEQQMMYSGLSSVDGVPLAPEPRNMLREAMCARLQVDLSKIGREAPLAGLKHGGRHDARLQSGRISRMHATTDAATLRRATTCDDKSSTNVVKKVQSPGAVLDDPAARMSEDVQAIETINAIGASAYARRWRESKIAAQGPSRLSVCTGPKDHTTCSTLSVGSLTMTPTLAIDGEQTCGRTSAAPCTHAAIVGQRFAVEEGNDLGHAPEWALSSSSPSSLVAF